MIKYHKMIDGTFNLVENSRAVIFLLHTSQYHQYNKSKLYLYNYKVHFHTIIRGNQNNLSSYKQFKIIIQFLFQD
jgi:hypothetical protein